MSLPGPLCELVVTGQGWMGKGIPALERRFHELLREAHEQITLTAYSVTLGAPRILDALEEAASSAIRVTLIVNDLESQGGAGGKARLLEIARTNPDSFHLLDFRGREEIEQLHAKVLLVDRKVALVGSANLSLRGMLRAHELGVILRGEICDEIAQALDRLIRSDLVLRRAGPGMD